MLGERTATIGIVLLVAIVGFWLFYRRQVPRNKSRAAMAAFLIVTSCLGYYFVAVDPIVERLNQGLDLQGGVHVVLEAVETPGVEIDEIAMQKALDIIRDRVDRLGVAEPLIQRAGDRRILVELPGVKETSQALEVIGRTAMLEFVTEDGETVFTGRDLKRADVTMKGTEPVVSLELTAEGAVRFRQATEEQLNRRILIVLDGEIISAPTVTEVIPDGRAIIQGYDTVESAYGLAIMLSSGALPVNLEVVENRSVSATLGQDSVAKGKMAAVIAAVAVAVFMLLYYRLPGFVATYAMALYLLLLLSALIAIEATLTLPGIAGIVLSIGMAVDANVIIFERIREEVKTGRTVRSAIDAGFRHAMRTVLDSNVTTLIGAAVLFYLGTGPIRGFAVTLSLGILASLFTAVVVTRWLLKKSVDAGLVTSQSRLFQV